MATNNITETDLNVSKRKIFIQNLSPQTTRRSLENYFFEYPMERCGVPMDEKTGRNRMHGIITFWNKESVDAVMSHRGHVIDGKQVFIHRADPTRRSVLQNLGIQQLIVSVPHNQSLLESDIEKYFSRYGEICQISQMENDEDAWVIDFDYYDSVDKILVYSPHRIGQIDVSVRRSDQNVSRRHLTTPRPSFNTDPDSNPGVIPMVDSDEQVSCLSLPEKKYRIHITNLPVIIDAETLSEELEWVIYDIVMDLSTTDRSQCWLTNANDEKEVDDFVRQWNGRTIGGSIIQCEKQEDELELCNFYQFGRCRKNADECHWEHVACTAEGTCASNCPYGHPFRMKSPDYSTTTVARINRYYRVKIIGFATAVTPQSLSQLFGPNNLYYVDWNENCIGYAIKIKTMKYAKQLMTKWHNKTIGGQKIQCQLEINPVAPPYHSHASSPTALVDESRQSHPSYSRPRDTRSLQSSLETSDPRDVDNTVSTSSINKEADRDRRIWGKAVNDITQPLLNTNFHHTSPSENVTGGIESKYRLPSDLSTNEWEVTNKAPNSDEKVLLIRRTIDRKHLAVVKIYPNLFLNEFTREIFLMKDLTDVKGVSQLIEPENTSNNLTQQRLNNDALWMILKRAPGLSLKEFIERKCQGVLEISTAIQLTLNLIRILQEVHNKGIFYRNLSPENIMIEWDSKSSIDRAQLTILNFNQALIVSNRIPTSVSSSKQKWYCTPQIDDEGMSSTVDPSGCCAILFWLLTQINPQYDNGELPHQQAQNKLYDMIKSTVRFTNTNQQIFLEEQLRKYLMNTFDRAFGYPHYHPWTINDLQCRLELILQLLRPIESKLNTIDDIFQELTSISDSFPTPPLTVNDAQQDALSKASKALIQAKQHFLKGKENQYEWSDGRCTWVQSPHSSMKECHHDDVLTYHSFRGRMSISYSVIITCLARCSDEGRVITLSISNSVNGKTIEMLIGQYSTARDYATNVQENFIIELTNLLLSIYKERKPIEQ